MSDSRPTFRGFVRRATENDVPLVLMRLHEAFASFRDAYTPGAWADTVLDRESCRRRVQSMSVFLAFEGDEDAIGTIACAAQEPATPERDGHIRGMAVRPAWYGTGVADALLNAALQELRSSGCVSATLDTVAPLERAIAFYVARSFSPTGRVQDFHGMELYEYTRRL